MTDRKEKVRTILETEIRENGVGSWADAWRQPRELALRTLTLPRDHPNAQQRYLLGIMPWGEQHVLVIVGSAWNEEAR